MEEVDNRGEDIVVVGKLNRIESIMMPNRPEKVSIKLLEVTIKKLDYKNVIYKISFLLNKEEKAVERNFLNLVNLRKTLVQHSLPCILPPLPYKKMIVTNQIANDRIFIIKEFLEFVV